MLKFFVHLVPGDDEFGGIDHDDEIARIHARGINAFVFTRQNACELGSEPSERFAFGVHHKPFALTSVGFA